MYEFMFLVFAIFISLAIYREVRILRHLNKITELATRARAAISANPKPVQAATDTQIFRKVAGGIETREETPRASFANPVGNSNASGVPNVSRQPMLDKKIIMADYDVPEVREILNLRPTVPVPDQTAGYPTGTPSLATQSSNDEHGRTANIIALPLQTADAPKPESRTDWNLLGISVAVLLGAVLLLSALFRIMVFPAVLGAAGFTSGMALLAFLAASLRPDDAKWKTALRLVVISAIYLLSCAAFLVYRLPVFEFALIMLLSCSVCMALIARQHGFTLVTAWAAFTGFAAPVVLGGATISPFFLFVYCLLLSVILYRITDDKSRDLSALTSFLFVCLVCLWAAFSHNSPLEYADIMLLAWLQFSLHAFIIMSGATKRTLIMTNMLDWVPIVIAPTLFVGLDAISRSHHVGAFAGRLVILGSFYAALSFWIRHALHQQLPQLIETFRILSIVSIVVAAVLLLAADLAAIALVLAGTAILWASLRYRNTKYRMLGLILQIASAYLWVMSPTFQNHWFVIGNENLPFLNTTWMTGTVIAVCAIVSAWFLHMHRENNGAARRYSTIMLLCGLLCWIVCGTAETVLLMFYLDKTAIITDGILVFLAASALIFAGIGYLYDWKAAKLVSLTYWPVFLCFIILQMHEGQQVVHLLRGFQPGAAAPLGSSGPWAYVFGAAASLMIAYWHESNYNKTFLNMLHMFSIMLGLGLIAWQLAWAISQIAPGSTNRGWQALSWLGVGSLLLWNSRACSHISWPVACHSDLYLRYSFLCIALQQLGLTILYNVAKIGQPETLAFPPLLNPFDIGQAFIFFSVLHWLSHINESDTLTAADQYGFLGQCRKIIMTAWSLSLFVWLNSLLLRALNYFLQIPITYNNFLASIEAQLCVCTLWLLIALPCLSIGIRNNNKRLWFCGCILLGATALLALFIGFTSIKPLERFYSFAAIFLVAALIGYLLSLSILRKPPANKPKTFAL